MTADRKHDLRDDLPGHSDPLTQDQLRHEQDARVASDPQIVTPEPGKNIPEGQNTKG